MPSFALVAVLLPLITVLIVIAAFLIYVWVRYCPFVVRIFEETPVFSPLRIARTGQRGQCGSEPRRHRAGRHLSASADRGAGGRHRLLHRVSWGIAGASGRMPTGSARPASTSSRSTSGTTARAAPIPTTSPSSGSPTWRSVDLQAALEYLRSRPDRDPAGVGVFGLSRGGGAALCVAADDPTIWGVVTDGAFPTRGTMMAYILRWAVIYIGLKSFWARMPALHLLAFVGWTGRITSQHRSGRRYPNIERAARRLAPRPWLMIHGEKDAYIGPDIARALFDHAGRAEGGLDRPRGEAQPLPGGRSRRLSPPPRRVLPSQRPAPPGAGPWDGRRPPRRRRPPGPSRPVPANSRPEGLIVPEPAVSP